MTHKDRWSLLSGTNPNLFHKEFAFLRCPRCQHPGFVKNGFINGKQRYKCKECEYQWTIEKTHRGRPPAEKALAVFLYYQGLSMNAIAKMLHGSPSTLLERIRNFGGEHAKPPEPQRTGAVVLELDEMWHSLNKKTLDMKSFLS